MSDVPEIQKQLTKVDLEFVSLMQQGFTKVEAYREAYRDHPNVKRLVAEVEAADNVAGLDYKQVAEVRETARKAAANLRELAYQKAKRKDIRLAFHHIVKRMETLAADAVDVWEEIMLYGRSEKVRADLAMEAVSHQLGKPTQKVLSQSDNSITITIGEAPPDTRDQTKVRQNKEQMSAGLSEQERKYEEAQEAIVIDMDVLDT